MVCVHADAHHYIFKISRFKVHGGFCQDAAELPAAEKNIIHPFDLGLCFREAFHGLAHGDRRRKRGHRAAAGKILFQKDGKVNAFPRRRKKGTPEAPLAARLPVGQKNRSVRRPQGRFPLCKVVGGIGFLLHADLRFRESIAQQRGNQLGGKHRIAAAVTIPRPRAFNEEAFFLQSIHRFPHRVPADAEFLRHFCAGLRFPLAFFQNIQYT